MGNVQGMNIQTILIKTVITYSQLKKIHLLTYAIKSTKLNIK